MPIPFSPPYVDEAVIGEVVDSLRSGWITTGPKVKALEEATAQMAQVEAALCVNSWTSGAMLMLRWLGLQPGDEVIVPAYTYSATALAVLNCGGKPVMVDVADDFNISLEAVKKALTPRTKAIMPVDIAGFPCNYPALMAWLESPEVKAVFVPESENQAKLGRPLLMADAAHSVGATINGLPAARFADITIYSYHAVKNITTAEGGAICLNLPAPFDNSAEYRYLRCYALNGQTKDAFTKSQAGGWRYDIVHQGMKINMPDICAAIGLAQIRQYPQLLAERRRVFHLYEKHFSAQPWAWLPQAQAQGRESSLHLYPLRIKGISEAQRDAMIDRISAQGVAVNVHFIPMPMLTLFKGLGYQISDYPQAYANYACEISLPVYPQLTDAQVAEVAAAVVAAYGQVVAQS